MKKKPFLFLLSCLVNMDYFRRNAFGNSNSQTPQGNRTQRNTATIQPETGNIAGRLHSLEQQIKSLRQDNILEGGFKAKLSNAITELQLRMDAINKKLEENLDTAMTMISENAAELQKELFAQRFAQEAGGKRRRTRRNRTKRRR